MLHASAGTFSVRCKFWRRASTRRFCFDSAQVNITRISKYMKLEITMSVAMCNLLYGNFAKAVLRLSHRLAEAPRLSVSEKEILWVWNCKAKLSLKSTNLCKSLHLSLWDAAWWSGNRKLNLNDFTLRFEIFFKFWSSDSCMHHCTQRRFALAGAIQNNKKVR